MQNMSIQLSFTHTLIIDSISNPHCPNSQAWGLVGNIFKLFHLNLCPPTKADCLKTAKKLVPVLRSSYSSVGENKWRSTSLVIFYFILPYPPLLLLHFKVHHACSCLMQWLIIKFTPISISTVSVFITQHAPSPVNRTVQLEKSGSNSVFFLLNKPAHCLNSVLIKTADILQHSCNKRRRGE